MRILVTDGMDPNAIAVLQQQGHCVVEQFYQPEQLGEALQGFDAVVVRSKTKIRQPQLALAGQGKLKLIVRGGVGVDNIDVEFARSLGITVRNTPDASSASVAELALGHMLCLARYIGIANVTMRQGQWNKKQYEGTELGGKVLGLVGFGRIAQELAKRAEALGMQILYTCPSGEKAGFPRYRWVPMEELLSQADYLSLHIPMPADGRPVITAEALAQMKPTAFLINTARGGVVDTDALLEALDGQQLAGAALDVFEQEPVADRRLLEHPGISVTPHIGGATKEAQSRIGQQILQIIKEFAE